MQANKKTSYGNGSGSDPLSKLNQIKSKNLQTEVHPFSIMNNNLADGFKEKDSNYLPYVDYKVFKFEIDTQNKFLDEFFIKGKKVTKKG